MINFEKNKFCENKLIPQIFFYLFFKICIGRFWTILNFSRTFLGLFFVNMVWSFYNNFNSRIFLMFLSLHLSILHQKQKAISKSITVWFVDMARTKWPTTNCIHIKYKMTIAQNLSINCNCRSRISDETPKIWRVWSIRNTIVDYGRKKLKVTFRINNSQCMSSTQIRNPSRLVRFLSPNRQYQAKIYRDRINLRTYDYQWPLRRVC